MRSYINRLIVTMVICQIAAVVSPESGKKYIRFVCGLVVLLTLISPVIRLRDDLSGIKESVLELIGGGEVTYSDGYEAAANMIFAYVSEKYSIGADDMRITFVTGGDGALCEIQIFVKNCPYAAKEEIKQVTGEEFGVDVYVFTEEGDDG